MSATFSVDRLHRYTLTRVLDADNPRVVQFIGLNPSTADETADDPTIRRCMGFARDWGCGVLFMTNLFSLRSTDPRGLYSHAAPNRIENDIALEVTASVSDIIICAWGVHGAYRSRGAEVAAMLQGRPLYCLGRTKDGHPKHPLYLSRATPRELFAPSP